MSINKEAIEARVKEINELNKKVHMMKHEMAKDLEQMDRDAFNGLNWSEFMSSIKEEVVVSENLTIERNSYRVIGKYHNEDVEITVYGNIYHNDNRFDPFVRHLSTDRIIDYSLNGVPKKYQKIFDEIVLEIRKYQFERPSEKYGKALGLAYY